MSSSYEFQAHWQHSQRRCFTQTALQWFEVLPRLSPVLQGAPMLVATCRLVIGTPRLVIGTPRLVVGAPRLLVGAATWYQVHPKFSPALRGILKLITITPKVLLDQSSEIPVTLKASRNALLGSETCLKLTHLGLHSTSSQTLLEASGDYNTFCCCRDARITATDWAMWGGAQKCRDNGDGLSNRMSILGRPWGR